MAELIFTEGAGLQDSVFGKSQAPIRMFIEKKAEAFEQESIVKHIFMMDKSSNYAEKLTAMTAMSGFQAVGENGEYPHDMMQESYAKTLEHMTWKDSFRLSQEMVEDSKTIDFKKAPSAFIAGYYRTREKFGAALLGSAIKGVDSITYAGKSFDTTSADGVSMFNAAHPSKMGGAAQSNMYSAAFSLDALNELETIQQNFQGDNGEILDVAPDTIIIPNIGSLKAAVLNAVGAENIQGLDIGYNHQFGRWNVIVWPYLNQFIEADTSPWMLFDSRYNAEYGGAVWLDRIPLSVHSTIDDETDANVWRGRARFIAGFADWRAFIVGGVTGGTAL